MPSQQITLSYSEYSTMSSRITINGKEIKNPILKNTLTVVLLLFFFIFLLLAAILLLPIIGIGIGIGVGAGAIALTTLAIRYRIARRRFAQRLGNQPFHTTTTIHQLPPTSQSEDQTP